MTSDNSTTDVQVARYLGRRKAESEAPDGVDEKGLTVTERQLGRFGTSSRRRRDDDDDE